MSVHLKLEMAKRTKLVDPSEPHASKSVAIQWELCILCQRNTPEEVHFPNQRKTAQGEVPYAVYRILAENLIEFNRLGLIPNTMNFGSMDERHGVEAAFIAHNACRHRSCWNVQGPDLKIHQLTMKVKSSSGIHKRTRSSHQFIGMYVFFSEQLRHPINVSFQYM